MKPFELTIAVRNNRLKERRLAMNLSQAQLAQLIGVTLAGYASLETMASSPVSTTRRCRHPDCDLNGHPRNSLCKKHTKEPGDWPPKMRWSNVALKLAEFHNCDMSELFPDAVLAVKSGKAVVKVDETDLIGLGRLFEQNKQISEEEEADRENLLKKLDDALDHLPPKERDIIQERFGLKGGREFTLVDSGKKHDLSRERIRQIENKALRRLRHPKNWREKNSAP